MPQDRTYTILHTFGAKLVFRWLGWPLNFTTAFRTLGNGDANLARWCSNHCQLIRHSTICGKLQNLGHNRVGIWGMDGAWKVQTCDNQSLPFNVSPFLFHLVAKDQNRIYALLQKTIITSNIIGCSKLSTLHPSYLQMHIYLEMKTGRVV